MLSIVEGTTLRIRFTLRDSEGDSISLVGASSVVMKVKNATVATLLTITPTITDAATGTGYCDITAVQLVGAGSWASYIHAIWAAGTVIKTLALSWQVVSEGTVGAEAS